MIFTTNARTGLNDDVRTRTGTLAEPDKVVSGVGMLQGHQQQNFPEVDIERQHGHHCEYCNTFFTTLLLYYWWCYTACCCTKVRVNTYSSSTMGIACFFYTTRFLLFLLFLRTYCCCCCCSSLTISNCL